MIPPEVFNKTIEQSFQTQVWKQAVPQMPRDTLETIVVTQAELIMAKDNLIKHLTQKLISNGIL